MTPQVSALALVALLLLAIGVDEGQANNVGRPGASSKGGCTLGFTPGTTVLFVADPGDFSNTPEAAQYLNNLKFAKELAAGTSQCPRVTLGVIMRQNVAVITTGIGPLASALCVNDILNRCGPLIKDVFYSGTSGWSPQLGGVINNGTCEAGQANTNGQIIRVGDVCVSPLSVNWDCRQASYLQTCGDSNGNQCVFPEQNFNAGADFLFGQCEFYNLTRAELALADEVLAVAATKSSLLPRRNAVVQALDTKYWSAMSNGTGIKYPTLTPTAPPTVYDYKECMEIDSQYFYSGAPWDMVARTYVAQVMNKGLGTRATQGSVLAVSAMEAIGVSMAFQRYNGLATTRRRIPYTNVRGASNWLHSPLIYKGPSQPGRWEQGEVIDNFEEGYKYAISTGSGLVLATLQSRCERGVSGRAGGRKGYGAQAAAVDPSHAYYRPGYPGGNAGMNMPCEFTIKYP